MAPLPRLLRLVLLACAAGFVRRRALFNAEVRRGTEIAEVERVGEAMQRPDSRHRIQWLFSGVWSGTRRGSEEQLRFDDGDGRHGIAGLAGERKREEVAA